MYSCLPNEWKVHRIMPVYKSGNHQNVENYCPMSLLCILSKVLESIIYNKIIFFIRSSLSHQQFGFLSNRSTVSQLLLSFSKIMDNCDKDVPTDIVYLDFKKVLCLCVPFHPVI